MITFCLICPLQMLSRGAFGDRVMCYTLLNNLDLYADRPVPHVNKTRGASTHRTAVTALSCNICRAQRSASRQPSEACCAAKPGRCCTQPQSGCKPSTEAQPPGAGSCSSRRQPPVFNEPSGATSCAWSFCSRGPQPLQYRLPTGGTDHARSS